MTKKLHILFLCSWFPTRVLKTSGDFIQRHAEAVSLLHRVSVLHIISDQSISKPEITISQQKNLTVYTGYLPKTKNPLHKLIAYLSITRKLLKRIDSFDAVHLNRIYPLGFIALYLKWFKSIPYIISEHWTGFLSERADQLSAFEKQVTKLIVSRASVVCPVSKFLEKSMLQLNFKGHYSCVGNVIDNTLFKPGDKLDQPYSLVHVSNLRDAQKNITGMLHVAKRLENQIGTFTWNFIGGNADEYQDLITKLNFTKANIFFEAHLNHKELAQRLQQADLCISFSNYESFGIVIPEAILCNTPVIATQTGIVNELPKSTSLQLISVGDEAALEAAILQQKTKRNIEEPSELQAYIQKKYSKDEIAKEFSKHYFNSLKLL
ncbi:glycosyltransferase family 4 protein [Bizionia sp.]|uniref:glycosyltransferase family 4 protein n=1 Tax=Bizionia sp. TaxID=1954480 RepID=UPI003A941D78